MITFFRTEVFDTWLKALRDLKAKARILARIRSAEQGNFGDCDSVGEGVFEMRIQVGPGYRVYYCRRQAFIYLLLCGGDKSTQQRDIVRARALLSKLEV